VHVSSDIPDSVVLRDIAWFSVFVMGIGVGLYTIANTVAWPVSCSRRQHCLSVPGAALIAEFTRLFVRNFSIWFKP